MAQTLAQQLQQGLLRETLARTAHPNDGTCSYNCSLAGTPQSLLSPHRFSQQPMQAQAGATYCSGALLNSLSTFQTLCGFPLSALI